MGRAVPVQALGKNWERVLEEVAAGSMVALVDPEGAVVAQVVTPDVLLNEIALLRKLRKARHGAQAGEAAQVIVLPARSVAHAVHAHAG
jgi:hypothetical protein